LQEIEKKLSGFSWMLTTYFIRLS